MRFKPIILLLSSLALVVGLTGPAGAQVKKVDLRVLFAGDPGTARTREYQELLSQHFTKVGLAPYSDFKPGMADGYDVVVFDSPCKAVPTGVLFSRRPNLPADFNRASVLISGGGVFVAMDLRLQLDWYCMCMSKEAHTINTEHAIFKGPFKVDMKLDTTPVPAHYRKAAGAGSPETFETWQVALKDYTTEGMNKIMPGLVSTGGKLDKLPDGEVISGGINEKSQGAVAIGRQGPFLLWGFENAPSNSTESGKSAFLNAIVYIAKFDRAPILTPRKGFPPRGMARSYNGQEEGVEKKENIPYLIAISGSRFAVDEDARALGLPNNKLELLDKSIALLKSGNDTERAQRVLKRYTALNLSTAGEWKTWLEKNRNDLVFSESGGYKWMIKGTEPPRIEDYQ